MFKSNGFIRQLCGLMIVVICMLSLSFAEAGTNFDTTDVKGKIDSICSQYNFSGDGKRYWSYNKKTGSSTAYTASTHKAVTTSSSGGEKDWEGYRFAGGIECWAFAGFIGYKLYGDKNPYSSWTKYSSTSAVKSHGLCVGDIIRTKGHSAVVYSIDDNGIIKVIECWGSYNNEIRIGGYINANKNAKTFDQIVNIYELEYVLHSKKNTNTPYLFGKNSEYSVISSNFDAYYTIKGIIPKAENDPNSFSATDNLPYMIDWDVYGRDRSSVEPFYYSPYTSAKSVDKHTVTIYHVTEIVKNKDGEEWLKLSDGTFILSSKMEEQYRNVALPDGPGIHVVSEPNQTQWGYAPFDAHNNGFDLKNGTEVYVARAVKNKYGNTWYELDSVGSNKWVYAPHLSFVRSVIDIDVSVTNASPASGLPKTSGSGIPTGNLPKGKSFELRGTVSASENISSITATVINLNTNNNALGPVTINPNSKSLDIYKSKINTGLIFDKLSDGAYRYTVIVTTASGAQATVIDSAFTIGSGSIPDDPGSLGDTVNRIPGDANEDGEVDIVDAMLIARWYCGNNLTINESNADVNQDGEVDVVDAMLIARWYCGYDATLK